MEEKFVKLRRFNLIMAGLHTIQGIVMLILSSSFALPVTSAFLKFNPATQSLSPDLQTLFQIKIGPAVAIFYFYLQPRI